MAGDVRQSGPGTSSTRSTGPYGYWCSRIYHLLIAYPTRSALTFLLMYLFIMDVVLFFKIRSRGPWEPISPISNTTGVDLLKAKLCEQTTEIDIFASLPVKKIMVGPTTQYIHSPLAEFVESELHFTRHFPSISANAISFSHCLLSFVTLKFLASPCLLRRQIGVGIFQFRNFLDCLDGVVFRAHTQNQHYKSYYNDWGYYIDAVSDVLGGICLLIGCFLYLSKCRPLRVATRQVPSRTCSSANDDIDLLIVNIDHEPSKSTTAYEMVHLVAESKERILLFFGLFTLLYAIAAMFWDRNVRVYESLLDSHTKNIAQKQTFQLSMLHSSLTIVIFYLWRYLSAISIQDYLLCAIFFDRTWEFIQRTFTIAWPLLLSTMVLSELHSEELRALFSHV